MRIWKVKPGSEDDNEGTGENEGEEAKWTAVSVADFDQHKSVEFLFLLGILFDQILFIIFYRSAVGRVEWNITG